MAPGVTLDREHTSSYEVTVTASDRLNASDSITVTINVSNVNEAPTAVNDTATTNEDQSVKIDVLANDTDPDTERAALRVSVQRQPLNGTARVESDRTITYTPNELRRREQLHLPRLRRLSQRRRLGHGHRRSGERRPDILPRRRPRAPSPRTPRPTTTSARP